MLTWWHSLRQMVTGTQLPWIILWLGLATLIVGLIVLTRTSWGQSHPLRKCAALSLLVHLLLAAYATTVQIVTAGTPEGHSDRGAIKFTLVEGTADAADPGTSTVGQPIWNNLPTGLISALPVANLTRPSVADPNDPGPQPQLTREALAAPGAPGLLSKPVLDPIRPDSGPSAISQAQHTTTVAAAPIDAPAPISPQPAANVVQPNATADRQPLTTGPAAASGPPDGPHGAGQPLVQVPGPEALAPIPTAAGDGSSVHIASTVDPQAHPAPVAMTPVSLPAGTPPMPQALPLGPPSPSASRIDVATSGSPASGSTASGAASHGATSGNSPGGDSSLLIVPSAATGGSGVRVPSSPVRPPDIYKDRTASDRPAILQRHGGSPETEAAVQAALAWLAAHQESDGHWDAEKYGAGREQSVQGHERGGAGAKANMAVTGLSILALQGSGSTHREGPYARNVQHGLEYLLNSQGADGNLGGHADLYAFMYSHGMATFALSEAYAMTHDRRLEQPLRAAIGYTLAAQHPTTGGWRYQPQETGDTSQLGWQLMSLKSAELAGLPMPQQTRDGVVRFLTSVASGTHGGLASYRPGEMPSRSMTAEALVCRQFLGMARDNPAANEAGDYLLGALPSKDQVNLYYWYYGTLGMYQLQGDYWRQWNEALQSALVRTQNGEGELAGSWDPVCIWGGYGGRIYSTSMSALCLEVYYRFLPLYKGRTDAGK